MPASMFPFMYDSGIEIMQSPGYVVIRLELIHETRIVPLDGRPPLEPGFASGSASRAAARGRHARHRDHELQRRERRC